MRIIQVHLRFCLRRMEATAALLVFLLGASLSQPIDNGLVASSWQVHLLDNPEIECSQDSVLVNFNTRDNFDGHVFVKGHYSENGCKTDATNSKAASISIPFSACGAQRQRSANPAGLFVGFTVIISFHPQFLTKVDRAFNVKCFYMEAERTVTSALNVSALTTQVISAGLQMPACKYDVLNEPDGKKVSYAKIGDRVYHQWSCQSEQPDKFCMTVHSCWIEDGLGQKVQLLDERGCPLDKYLLGKLDYVSNLKAGNWSQVFKFADQPSVYFNCQIRLALKDTDKCKRSSDECLPPIRGKRAVQLTSEPSSSETLRVDVDQDESDGQEIDVFSPSIIVFEDQFDLPSERFPGSLLRPASAHSVNQDDSTGFVCFSKLGFGLLISAAAIVMLSSIVIVAICCIRTTHHHYSVSDIMK